MTAIAVIAGHALRESLRRRVFLVVLILTIVFLALYGVGVAQVVPEIEGHLAGEDPSGILDRRIVAGATLVGLAMFGTLFLGTVLAVFLTLGAVRGDADRGLLQPLVVRPVGRAALLVARFLAAASVAAVYVCLVYAATLVETGLIADWWPSRPLVPALALAAAVTIVAAVSLFGSVHLSATANGIAVFMLFGAGLVAGLLGQVGEALASERLIDAARIATWALPFEALYQAGLAALTADTTGISEVVVRLGPFGGAQDGSPALVVWVLAYLAMIGVAAVVSFRRRDL